MLIPFAHIGLAAPILWVVEAHSWKVEQLPALFQPIEYGPAQRCIPRSAGRVRVAFAENIAPQEPRAAREGIKVKFALKADHVALSGQE